MEKFRKTELWLATGFYLLVVFALFYPFLFYQEEHMGNYPMEELFLRYNVPFDPFIHLLMAKLLFATACYAVFLLMNNLVVPKLLERGKWVSGVALTLCNMTLFFILVMIYYTYRYGYMLAYKGQNEFYDYCAGRALVMLLLASVGYIFYYGLKYIYFDTLHERVMKRQVWKMVSVEMVIMLAGWVIWLVVLSQDNRPAMLKVIFVSGLFYILLYFIAYHYLFPPFIEKQQSSIQLFRNLGIAVLVSSFLALYLIGSNVSSSRIGALFVLFILGEILFVLPLAWFLARVRISRKDKVLHLERALGRSSANLDFLRSQINPHFLFNALNTLYGTALQEHAPRTSEGVQKLGDMMRFMLHENHQEKIELDKEIAYLQNYISLQRLRTQTSPDIKIEVNINEQDCEHMIAPMLLIPFVENAFKHGISLRNRSWIVVTLSCDKDHIYFDVYNSVHPKPLNDPEKMSLGIGLNNVKHRLALIYPKKHELSIRETASEFFVHLTITTQ